MDDKSILFFCITMSVLFLYRIILSVLFLAKKKFILDEKYYIMIFYCSLVSSFVLFSNFIIVGFILLALTPIILTLYVSLAPTRKYWIINGYTMTESTIVNKLILLDEKYKTLSYRAERVKISKRKSESKTMLEFIKLNFEEKEHLLKVINTLCKENTAKSNKVEIKTILINLVMIVILQIFVIFTLFT